jgi:hypothetical protein
MRFLKRFNEDLEAQEEVQSGEKYTDCIDAAKDCIEAINQVMDDFKDADDLESVIKLNECILTCELYIYSCENETEHFSRIADLTKDVVSKIAELKSETEFPETACLKLVSEIEKCKESKSERGVA